MVFAQGGGDRAAPRRLPRPPPDELGREVSPEDLFRFKRFDLLEKLIHDPKALDKDFLVERPEEALFFFCRAPDKLDRCLDLARDRDPVLLARYSWEKALKEGTAPPTLWATIAADLRAKPNDEALRKAVRMLLAERPDDFGMALRDLLVDCTPGDLLALGLLPPLERHAATLADEYAACLGKPAMLAALRERSDDLHPYLSPLAKAGRAATMTLYFTHCDRPPHHFRCSSARSYLQTIQRRRGDMTGAIEAVKAALAAATDPRRKAYLRHLLDEVRHWTPGGAFDLDDHFVDAQGRTLLWVNDGWTWIDPPPPPAANSPAP